MYGNNNYKFTIPECRMEPVEQLDGSVSSSYLYDISLFPEIHIKLPLAESKTALESRRRKAQTLSIFYKILMQIISRPFHIERLS